MFPHIYKDDYKLPLQTSGLDVTVDLGTVLRFQDVPFDTDEYDLADREFTLLPNKVYHLRFSFAGEDIVNYDNSGNKRKFYAVPLDDPDYNPSGQYEPSASVYDTTETDAKYAKITTNGIEVIDVVLYPTISVSELDLEELSTALGGSSAAVQEDIDRTAQGVGGEGWRLHQAPGHFQRLLPRSYRSGLCRVGPELRHQGKGPGKEADPQDQGRPGEDRGRLFRHLRGLR